MIVGIDLGTTHSLIGAFVDGRPQLFPNALGSLLTPSAISVDDAGDLIVGEAARDRLITHPSRSVATFKRWMGRPVGRDEAKRNPGNVITPGPCAAPHSQHPNLPRMRLASPNAQSSNAANLSHGQHDHA